MRLRIPLFRFKITPLLLIQSGLKLLRAGICEASVLRSLTHVNQMILVVVANFSPPTGSPGLSSLGIILDMGTRAWIGGVINPAVIPVQDFMTCQ